MLIYNYIAPNVVPSKPCIYRILPWTIPHPNRPKRAERGQNSIQAESNFRLDEGELDSNFVEPKLNPDRLFWGAESSVLGMDGNDQSSFWFGEKAIFGESMSIKRAVLHWARSNFLGSRFYVFFGSEQFLILA